MQHSLPSLLQTRSVFLCYDLFTLNASQPYHISPTQGEKPLNLIASSFGHHPALQLGLRSQSKQRPQSFTQRNNRTKEEVLNDEFKTILLRNIYHMVSHVMTPPPPGPSSLPDSSYARLLRTYCPSISEPICGIVPQMKSIAFHVNSVIWRATEKPTDPMLLKLINPLPFASY